jgi:hypothetical protein
VPLVAFALWSATNIPVCGKGVVARVGSQAEV